MSAGGRRAVVGALAAAGVALLVLAGALPFASGPPGEVPTFVVERQSFRLTVPAEGNLVAARATPVTTPSAARGAFRIAWLAPDGAPVSAGDPVIRFDPTELEQQEADAGDEVTGVDLRRRQKEALSEALLENLERDAEAAELELAMVQEFETRDPELYSRLEGIESEIDSELAGRRLEHAEATRRAEELLRAAELDLLSIERRKAGLRLEQAQEGLSSLEVTAPHDGILVLTRNWQGETLKVGDTVWGRQRLAEIPDLSEMQAEVYVLEADAGALAPGRPARVVVESHPERTFDATIARVGSLAQPRVPGSPVQYFAVTLSLERTEPAIMRPGARVRAELHLAEVEDALVVPRQAIFEVDGRSCVYRRRGGGFEAVEVALRATGPGRVVVEGELAPGDELALTDPHARPAEEESGPGVGRLPAPGGGA